jgi:hypothetical protein
LSPSKPLSLLGAGFAVFALILLVAPPILVAKKARSWHGVVGLWVAGWGFLLIGIGTYFAYRGWSNLVVVGVLVSGVGYLLQRRAAGGRAS